MATNVSAAANGMGLNDFGAMQEGLFAGEGSVEFDTNLFAILEGFEIERTRDIPFSACFKI